jgi:hypothetical protein
VSPPSLSAEDETRLRTDLADMWRDAAEASLRYWGRLGRLAFESVTALVALVAELRPGEAGQAALPEVTRAARTILVEAEAGHSGMGVFLVENTTPQQLSIPVSVSSFLDPDGREVNPAVAFQPDVILLDPGDQLVVQVAAAVDETLEPDVRYHAEISVPGLSQTRIPIVVRRRASAAPRRKRQAKKTTSAS